MLLKRNLYSFNLLLSLLLIFPGCDKLEKYEGRDQYYKNLAVSPSFDSTLMVVTYNIQCGFEAGQDPWAKDLQGGTPAHINRLADVINKSGAAIVLLQEVPFNRANTEVKDLLAALANATGMNYAFGSHGYNDPYGVKRVRGQWGNAILSKYEITEIENVEVARVDVWERRSVLRARLKLTESLLIDCFSLHHLPGADKQLDRTTNFIKASPLAKIVGGDFNAPPDGVAASSNLVVIQKDSIVGIDHILIDAAFHAVKYGIVPSSRFNGIDSRPSDHEPVYAEIRMK